MRIPIRPKGLKTSNIRRYTDTYTARKTVNLVQELCPVELSDVKAQSIKNYKEARANSKVRPGIRHVYIRISVFRFCCRR